MLLILSTIAFLVVAATILATAFSVKQAPVAYEDDTGFHREQPSQASFVISTNSVPPSNRPRPLVAPWVKKSSRYPFGNLMATPPAAFPRFHRGALTR